MKTLINNIRQTLVDALDRLIPERARCALIDFPAHPNVGDSAIWLGERAYLRQRGVNVVYTCDVRNYSKSRLERSIGEGTILIHGGGNFGDLWPHHHALRMKVLRDFPRQRIIQLPQSIHFERSSALDESKRGIDAHAHFVMMTRDRQSFEIFTRHFSQPCHLAPDGAFGLGPQEVSGTPSSEFFWLKRLDKESLGSTGPELLNGILAQDWLQDSRAVQRIAALLGAAKKRSLPVKRIEKGLYDVLARARLRRGYRTLRQGRVVITERLHGHILCLLGGIPNVLIDNSYGKNAAFYSAWIRDWPGTGFVSTPAAAKTRAQQLLEGDVIQTVAV